MYGQTFNPFHQQMLPETAIWPSCSVNLSPITLRLSPRSVKWAATSTGPALCATFQRNKSDISFKACDWFISSLSLVSISQKCTMDGWSALTNSAQRFVTP